MASLEAQVVVNPKDEYQYIVAIDFGTAYSGYAYASRDDIDLENHILNVSYSQVYNSGGANLISHKTPSSILLDCNEDFLAFGYEAENKFVELVEEGKSQDYYFFRRFKMGLYDKNVVGDFILKDEHGKSLPAAAVFAKSILALKNEFLKEISVRGIHLKKGQIRWVITVPAIWTDSAKQFMRKCAHEAGIQHENMIIALEPEAASMFCQYVKTKSLKEDKALLSKIGTQYLVADLGGGTTDITVHETMANGFLKEIHRATGNDCGGGSINDALVRELAINFGESCIPHSTYPAIYYEVHREIEAAKKVFDPLSDNKMALAIPHRLIGLILKKIAPDSSDLLKVIQIGPHGSGVEFKQTRILIDPVLAREKLYKPTADRIINLMKDVISKLDDSKFMKILLVGGFSQCKFIQDAIKSEFPNKQIIVPGDPDLCIVKGAVLFGHQPNLISQRVVRFTYGIKSTSDFDPLVHDPNRKVIDDGVEICRGVFSIFVKTGTVIEVNKRVEHSFSCAPFQEYTMLEIYTSTLENPIYIDEPGCEKIGTMEFKIPNPSDEIKTFTIAFTFGSTELKVSAKVNKSGQECQTTLDLAIF